MCIFSENFTNISNRFEKSRTFAKGYADSDINARNYINNNQYDICMVVDTANTFPTDGGVRYYKYNSPIKYTFKNCIFTKFIFDINYSFL